MKTKYLLRGIGIGIIIGALIMYAAGVTGNKASANDKKVAKEVTTEAEKTTTEEKTTEATTEKTTEKATEKTEEKTTEATTEKTTEKTTEATEEKTTEATTEKKTEEKTTEATTEEKTTEEKTTEAKSTGTKKITVTSGMGSETISSLLAEQGLVKSASDYNAWLIEKGYDSKLHIGTFEIKEGATYEEIAKILTTQGQ